MIETSLIDPQVFQALYASTGQDPEFLRELMDTYFQDAPQLLADMRAALAAGNAADFRRAAHSLKSNSANFGARHLAALCKELEDKGKAGVLDGAGAKIELIQAEYAQVKAALEHQHSELIR
jgi:HPt (histidine-containing phosphotransfer) domain-containing protein